ncbi:hypothetical protein G7046_g4857 [Stylonectria norvegica]|nr:hypothetical protein G7046_g4857 [Stylonectria norvegica]
MIEPIGLIGTLIAIVQVCNKVVSVCYEYRSGFKDAPKDISRILDEVASVRNIAERLVSIAEADYSSSLPSLQSMSEPESALHKCLDELVDLKKKLKIGKKVTLLTALIWPLKQAEAEKRLLVIGRIKATLQLALAADNAHNIVQVLAQVQSLPIIQEKVTVFAEQAQRTAEQAERDAEDDEITEIIHWLGNYDQASKHRDAYKKCTEGTGQWLLDNKTYLEWKADPGQLLWVNGNGSLVHLNKSTPFDLLLDSLHGLTFRSAKVIEDLHDSNREDDYVGLSYSYVEGSDAATLEIEHLYRSFIAQLLASGGEIPRYLERLHRLHGPKGRSRHKTISIHDWEEVIGQITRPFNHIYVALDALDEIEETLNIEEIEGFVRMIQRLARSKIHIIAFSRDLERLRSVFSSLNAATIAVDEEALSIDLQTALRHQLSSQPKFARWPPSLKKTIETSLLSQAKGSFRWLDCQLQTLRKCATPVAVRKVLSDLPKSLEAYYTRILENLDESNRVSVHNLLRWVAFSMRPLSLQEIASAIAINSENVDSPFLDEDLELLDVEAFLDSCSSLVSTYNGAETTANQQIVYLKLAHFSVREFLLSKAILTGPCEQFAMEKSLAHSCLANSCLAYFHQAVLSGGDDFLDESPLATYAGRFWLEHKKLSGRDWPSTLHTFLADMFKAKGAFYQNWQKVTTVDRPWLDGSSEKSPDYTPLYCAAFNGQTTITEMLLEKGASPNETGGLYGNPLQAAALNGHLETVRALIRAHANINAVGGTFGYAISAATANGHVEVVEELLEAGARADPDSSFSRHERIDPLFVAATHGQLKICQLLLEYGAHDTFRMKARTGSALQAAAQLGRLDIVRTMLLYKRIRDTNSRVMRGIIRPASGGFAASQYAAAALNHVEVVRELADYGMSKEEVLRYAARAGDDALVVDTLDQGIDIDAPGEISDHPRALESAALGGHISIVKELLARGADPKIVSRHHSTALAAAIEGGSLEVVQVLIDAGADVNHQRWPLPLDEAMRHGRRDITELLVQRGANADAALRRAVIRGDFQAFQLLLKLGADIDAVQMDDPTPMLQAAARGGSIPIAQYLLDHGQEKDLDSGRGGTTPLVEAVQSQKWEVAQLLLDRGANIKAPLLSGPVSLRDNYYNGYRWPPPPANETPLTMAVKHGNQEMALALMNPIRDQLIEVIHELLQRGVDVNQKGTIPGRQKPTFPLLLAAEKGNVEILEPLITAGARVNDQDGEGFSPLHVAAACSDPAGLQLVLDRGANVDIRLQNGSRPIHSAACGG